MQPTVSLFLFVVLQDSNSQHPLSSWEGKERSGHWRDLCMRHVHTAGFLFIYFLLSFLAAAAETFPTATHSCILTHRCYSDVRKLLLVNVGEELVNKCLPTQMCQWCHVCVGPLSTAKFLLIFFFVSLENEEKQQTSEQETWLESEKHRPEKLCVPFTVSDPFSCMKEENQSWVIFKRALFLLQCLTHFCSLLVAQFLLGVAFRLLLGVLTEPLSNSASIASSCWGLTGAAESALSYSSSLVLTCLQHI